MNDISTVQRLRSMKMNAFASEPERQLADNVNFSSLGFEERLGLLVDCEWDRRQANKLNRYIHNARFSESNATIESIEYLEDNLEDRHLDKKQILRFSTCKYIDDGHHIILKGASGNGKTYIACALGNSACRKFRTVKYIRMPELLDELTVAKDNGEFKKVIDAYKKVDLLILDEWLIRRLTPAESYIMPEIAEARCKRSMIFCTQYEPEGWYERINPDPESESPISEAIMDRIIHNSFIMPIDGRISMRERYGVSSEVES